MCVLSLPSPCLRCSGTVSCHRNQTTCMTLRWTKVGIALGYNVSGMYRTKTPRRCGSAVLQIKETGVLMPWCRLLLFSIALNPWKLIISA